MEFFFFYFGLALAVAFLADKKSRNPFGWFLLAIIFSPILAGIILLCLWEKPNPANQARTKALGEALTQRTTPEAWQQMPALERIKVLQEIGHPDPALGASKNWGEGITITTLRNR